MNDADNEVLVSAVSAWEIATKHRLGKLDGASAIVADIGAVITDQSFTGLPVSLRHGQIGGALPGPLKDPFDRMLIAQALADSLVLVSNEHDFDRYGISRLW